MAERTGVPVHEGQFLGSKRPLDGLLLGSQILQAHGERALLDLVLGERLEVRGQAQPLGQLDEPLGGVVLVPLDGVPVVGRELVVEVVVPLAHGDEGREEVVAGRVLVVERSLTQPVGERVDAEHRLGRR